MSTPTEPPTPPSSGGTPDHAGLPLGSRSHTAWAAALVGLAEPSPALVELTVGGALRWWSPRPVGEPDPLRLVWARRADRDVDLAGLMLGAVDPGRLVDGVPGPQRFAAVVATRSGDCSVTVGSWPSEVTVAGGRGAAVDAMLLYLGLATPPEARTPGHLVGLVWLDRLLAAAVGAPGRIDTWATAAAHHPLYRPGDTAPEVVSATADLAAAGWDPIRLAVASGAARWGDLDPAGAAWMDRGAFARWLLDRYPDPQDQCEALGVVLPDRLARTVCDVVEAAVA
ncbi:MAG: hypothetical protein R2704_04570 [Microthrixaceae bacterium]|nr:hypothetical protein [Microthrixaceae bacterium]